MSQSFLPRPISLPAFEVPRRLRAFVRARETSVVVLAALVGALAGLVVAGMGIGVDLLHQLFFGLGPGERLSARFALPPEFAFFVPFAGGLAFGLVTALVVRQRPTREIDPIEANALHGGRMSLRGSVFVALQTVWSSGVGASVGLEAGYTQLASGIASRIGQAFRLRRSDLRILVGCGAAGGIAGAFGAPLAGAFYAFELVIGSYSVTSLAPVGISALVGYLVARSFAPAQLGIITPDVTKIAGHDLVLAGALGLFAACFGIVLMRCVALCESMFLRLRVPSALRPGLGGAAVGLLAMISPQVMSSGHGALHLAGVLDRPLQTVALLFALKAAASIVSLGSGFRGGLFFASLLLGALGGHIFAAGLNMAAPAIGFDPNSYALIGMSALAASVIGGPLTMIFIALETTGDLWLATAVLIAVIISGQVTREVFGYSFATWRFHLRGETIRSAADVGWIRELTVGRMMRPDVRTTFADTPLPAFREAFPLGSTGQVVAIDQDGRYAGLVIVPEAHAAELSDNITVRDIIHNADDMLLPGMTVQDAVAAFDRTEAEALAVVESRETRRVIGLLTEAHVLRRYSAELDLRRRELLGEV
ncbi:MAG TPA: chloride channel protein [Xanthobacteraceae bacterium]|nr:chloride channel protein [Xanthobacteraceae bacterium]